MTEKKKMSKVKIVDQIGIWLEKNVENWSQSVWKLTKRPISFGSNGLTLIKTPPCKLESLVYTDHLETRRQWFVSWYPNKARQSFLPSLKMV